MRCNRTAVLTAGLTLVIATGAAPIYGKSCTKPVTLDFETGTFRGWDTRKLTRPYSARVVTGIVRRGRYAARFELRGDEWVSDGVRAELKENCNAPLGVGVWYSFSTYIPEDFPMRKKNCVIAQWHGEHDEGEVARSPVLVHRYMMGTLRIEVRHSSRKLQQANDGARIVVYEQKDFPRGVWHDFLYHVVWSHRDDGRLEGWLDGEKIIDYRGPIGYNDDLGPYFKFGLYHHDGDKPYVIYHDEYRRGFRRADVEPPDSAVD